MSDPVNGNGHGANLRWWVGLLGPMLGSGMIVIITMWASTQVMRSQADTDREALKAFIEATNTKFEALSLRIGNQDALIGSTSAMTARLDERMKAMVETNAAITARRDQQFDGLDKRLDSIREEAALGREQRARAEAKIDSLLEAIDGRTPPIRERSR